MKNKILLHSFFTILYFFITYISFAVPIVTLTSSHIANADINQGSQNVIVYAVKMDVATDPVTVNQINFTMTGTHDADDLQYVYVYYNTTPTLTGAAFMGNSGAAFASGHAYSLNINKSMTAGSSGYFIIVVYANATATDNSTVKVDAGVNPVTFGYNTAPNITNNQSGGGGTLTIQGADITYTSSHISDADINQGSQNVMTYAVKMDVATEPVTVNKINFTMTGTHDADDLQYVYIYYNSTPTLTGAAFMGNSGAAFASGHAYSLNINKSMTAGSSGYFIIVVYANATATDNSTVKVDADVNPVTFGYNTAPNITNNQSGGGGTLTIQGADITYTSSHISDADINQGSQNVMTYAVKMDVATEPVTVNKINFTMTGTYDADDIDYVYIYFNTTPTLTGASFLTNAVVNDGSGHAYSLNINKPMTAGSSGYFIIVVYANATATDNSTVKVDADVNPVTFGYDTAPNITNNQSGGGGTLTIQGADITYTSSHISDADINQGSQNVMTYAVKMDVATEPVTVNKINFTMTGTYDADDIDYVYIYFNTTPTLTGASFLTNAVVNEGSGHAYSLNINKPMTPGSSGYFIIVTLMNSAATDNNTIKIDADANPVTFGYVTAPNVTNNQSGGGGTLTIQAADITMSTSPTSAGTIAAGSSNNIIYGLGLGVATEPVVVSQINFTLNGTHDADDLSHVYIYYNTTPSLTGASYVSNTTANYANGHAYSVNIYKPIPAGTSGYFILTVTVNPGATIGNTVFVDGASNPVGLGYTTAPNSVNSQSNNAGVMTISGATPVTLFNFAGNIINDQVNLSWQTGTESNSKGFAIERSADGRTFIEIGFVDTKAENGNSAITLSYTYKDEHPGTDENFYRLRQIDKDGKYYYSNTIAVRNKQVYLNLVKVYPNPAHSTLNVYIESKETRTLYFDLINPFGKVIDHRRVSLVRGGNNIQMNVSRLASGSYLIRVVDDEFGNTIKQFVKY